MCQTLLDHGADPRVCTKNGRTVLHQALNRRKSDAALLTVFLDAGVSADRPDKRGLTALHLAAMNGDVPCAQALLVSGASPSLLDAEGRSALLLTLSVA